MIQLGDLRRRNLGNGYDLTYIQYLHDSQIDFSVTDDDIILVCEDPLFGSRFGAFRIIIVRNCIGYVPEHWLLTFTVLL